MNARALFVLASVVLVLGACGEDANDGRLSERDGAWINTSVDAADGAEETEVSEPCRIEKDQVGDGVVDDVSHYEYDADGLLLSVTKERYDQPSVTTYEYDSQGRVSGTETDSDSNGAVDSRSSVRYEPREDGGYIGTWDTDHGIDGTIDLRSVYEYDVQERLVAHEQDSDMDGATDFATVHTYNADGTLATVRLDFEGDGDPESLWTYFYEDGVLVRVEMDSGGDGEIDWVSRYFYEDGQLVRRETEGDAGSRRLTYTTWYFYDC